MALSHGFSAQYAQSVAFLTLIFGQLWHLFDSRTFTSLYRVNPFTNKYLLGAIAASAILSLGVIYTHLGQLIFSTEAIELRHLAMILGVAALPTAVLSAIKELTKTKVL
ncbi:cation-transporting ATPase [Vibrio sp. JCM 19052]|nr:cation-transporting ATPase [Vibrio sp. JCM 19052]